jgi:hypothetical protein
MKQKTKTETRNMGDQKNHNACKQNRSLMYVKKIDNMVEHKINQYS